MADEELIQIGHFGRAHGVRGEMRFFAENPRSDLLKVGLRVFVGGPDRGRWLTCAKVRATPKFYIMAFDELDDRGDAEALTNRQLAVAADALPELDEDAFYLRDLVGCPVDLLADADQTTRRVGEVAGFFETGANEVMVVDLDATADEQLFVPLVDHAVAEVRPNEVVVLFPLDQWAPEGTDIPAD